jgi:hypothetical protein
MSIKVKKLDVPTKYEAAKEVIIITTASRGIN